jgi:hypothetical protein
MFMQRMAYSHLYFAYEHFLLFCARVAGDLPKLKATDQKGKTFKDVLSKEFDPYVTDLCWSCETIQLVKRARNVIVHNGCKIDKPIGSLRVRDGELQVLPHDVANLFIVLKERVIILVGRALANKRFQ